ncbi:MAG: hypothetical protein GC138_03350 [Gammaproteobacteria bacterium]|nr:hypothetical protein [Gammaproteobacteria bacterium]
MIADYCGPAAVNENGLYQRKVVVAGEVYYQTIVVDGNATGDPNLADFSAGSIGFSNESFIKAGSGSGIAANAYLAQLGSTSYLYAGTGFDLPTDAGNFSQNVVLNAGWANQGTVLNPTTGVIEPHAVIAIDQGLSVPEYGVTFTASMAQQFTLERGMSEADKRITLDAKVGTLSGTVATPFIEPIALKTVTVTGAYQQTARTDFVDPFVLPSAQADLPWVAGDALQATWLGAHYGTNPVVPATDLNTTSFTNRTTSESVSYTGLKYVPTGPDNWFINPFLTAPTYP